MARMNPLAQQDDDGIVCVLTMFSSDMGLSKGCPGRLFDGKLMVKIESKRMLRFWFLVMRTKPQCVVIRALYKE